MNQISFDAERIAQGYAKRPWLHRSVMEQLYPAPGPLFKNGLDVGCGAGLSTKALRRLCKKVTGTDISDALIQVCRTL